MKTTIGAEDPNTSTPVCPVTYSEAMVLATGVAGSATAVHLPLDLDRSPAVLTAGLKNLATLPLADVVWAGELADVQLVLQIAPL